MFLFLAAFIFPHKMKTIKDASQNTVSSHVIMGVCVCVCDSHATVRISVSVLVLNLSSYWGLGASLSSAYAPHNDICVSSVSRGSLHQSGLCFLGKCF